MANKWAKPKDVSDADLAFPAKVCGVYLPPVKDIPKEIVEHYSEWNRKANSLMFSGGDVDLKPEIDRKMAIRQLRACLGSFEPKHEHKTAGVGYLLSLWCNTSA